MCGEWVLLLFATEALSSNGHIPNGQELGFAGAFEYSFCSRTVRCYGKFLM